MNNQKGAAHVVLVLLLLGGLATSLYLVGQQTNILPKAASPKVSVPQVISPKKPISAPITPKPSRSPSAEDKVGVCHKTGSIKIPFTLISISGNALDIHLEHGDIYPVPETGCPTL